MIVSIRHKGMKALWEQNDPSLLQPSHVEKIRNILTRLSSVSKLSMMNYPGSDLKPHDGELEGYWSVLVDKSHRILFRFDAHRKCSMVNWLLED